MSRPLAVARSDGRIAGVALIVCSIALVAVSGFEFSAGDARGDGDDPAQSLDYLQQHGLSYAYSGFALVGAAASLLVGVIGTHRLIRTSQSSLAFDVITAVGVLAGGFLAVTGVMRMQATGTVPYIRELSQAWGESAYLVVQIAGTQGLLSAGIIGLAAWLVGFAILGARRGVRWLLLLAILPSGVLLVLLVDLALPFLSEIGGGTVFVVYVAGILFGIPACCLGFGIALLVPRVGSRLASLETLTPPR